MSDRARMLAGAVVVALLALTPAARADSKAGKKAPATKPAGKAPPEVMKILQDLEAAGKKYKTLRADIRYAHVDEALGDREERTGWVAYQAAVEVKGGRSKPAKFRIQFETLRQGRGKQIRDRITYAFDGLSLTVAKHRIKTIDRYQVAAKGERVEPTKLGQGPLPLPFGQEADNMVEHFEITTRPLEKGEPKNTLYLHLATRKRYRKSINFRTLEMWVHKVKHLPAKLISTDKNDTKTTVEFRNIKTNPTLASMTFLFPRLPGWTLNVNHLKTGTDLKP